MGVGPASADGAVVDRILRDPRIGESSGLVASTLSPGIVWTHDDSGNPPLLYALARDGSTAATVRVLGVPDVDWEALAPARARDGSPLLAVGDFGDNNAVRRGIEIDLVREPRIAAGAPAPGSASAGSGSAASGSAASGAGGPASGRSLREDPVRVLHLRYPDGAHDAETLLSDPRTGRLYVVTKGLLSSTVYAVPAQAWPGGTGRSATATLQPVGQVALTLVTDGAVLPDGRVLLRTYGSLAVLAPLPAPGPAGSTVPQLEPLATTGLPAQRQGEGLAVADAAAGVLLLSSEGVGEPVLRLTVPAEVRQAGAAAAASSGTAGSSGAAGRGSGGTSGAGGSSGTAGVSGTGPSGATASGAGAAAGTAAASVPPSATAWSTTSAALVTLAGAAAFGLLLLLGRLARRLRART